jgi:tetratricopeptide (TPR) repeat protein
MKKEELLERYEAIGEERDFAAARPLYEQALADAPDARVLNDYGYLLFAHARRELRRAVELYERAIALDPAYDKPHFQLIVARGALQETELAVRMYEQRLRDAPGEVREHRFLATAYLNAHAFERALTVAEAGLRLAPDDAALCALRGEAKAGLNDSEGALASSSNPRTSVRSTAAPSCSSGRGGLRRRPRPGVRSSSGTSRAGTRFRASGRGRNSAAWRRNEA